MMDTEEMESEDMDILKSLRYCQTKKRKSFRNVINNKELSEDELDELFLAEA